MLSTRQTAVAVGVLFLTITVTFYIADMLIVGVLNNPDTLADLSAYGNILKTSAFLAFVVGIGAVSIAVLIYPLLKNTSQPLALGYVGFRVVEFAAILLYMAAPLLVVELGEGALGNTLGPTTTSQYLASLLQSLHEVARLNIWFSTGLAGTLFAIVLYRSRLVPRSITVFGLIGYPVLFVGTTLYMFGLIDLFHGAAGTIVAAPAGLFELILPIWLFAKGFTCDREVAWGG